MVVILQWQLKIQMDQVLFALIKLLHLLVLQYAQTKTLPAQ